MLTLPWNGASEELKFQNFLLEDSPGPPYKLAPFHQTSYAKNLDLPREHSNFPC